VASDPSQDATIPTTPRGVSVDFDPDDTRTVAQPPESAGESPTTTASHIALPVGYALHEYTIEAVLGAGGFGISYRARDNNLQCRVAIKEYLPNDLAVRVAGQSVVPRSDSDAYRVGLERFLAEARVLAGFRHPNIVRVSRFFEANGTAYMVMDYEQGESLREWLHGHSPVDEAALKRMFLPLLDGLAIVHQAGVVHRDIKPANIYVRDADGSLVLLDFGAARQTTGVPSRSLTSIVTPGYAPFEQYHTRGAQGPWTDLYALAGVMYWLVTGQKPLEAPSRIKDDIMIPAAAAAAGRFSPGFLAAIDWALRVDEDARPRSVAEFRPVLMGEAPAPAHAGMASAPRAETGSPATGGKRGKLKFVAIAAVACVAVIGIFALTRAKKAPSPPVPPVVAEQGAPKAPAAQPVPAAPTAVPAPAPQRPVAERPARPRPPPGQQADPAKTAPAAPPAAGGAIATVTIEILPPGEQGVVLVDGKRVGVAPPLQELKLPTGWHRVTVRGDKMPFVHHFLVDLEPNERRKLSARFGDGP
jgi:hypothetical protein